MQRCPPPILNGTNQYEAFTYKLKEIPRQDHLPVFWPGLCHVVSLKRQSAELGKICCLFRTLNVERLGVVSPHRLESHGAVDSYRSIIIV